MTAKNFYWRDVEYRNRLDLAAAIVNAYACNLRYDYRVSFGCNEVHVSSGLLGGMVFDMAIQLDRVTVADMPRAAVYSISVEVLRDRVTEPVKL